MRIRCPFCGERDTQEFAYHGDAAAGRPELVPEGAVADETRDRVVEAVYLLDNPAGPHEGLWYHRWGCRSWLTVGRDTRSHEIFSVMLTKPDSTR